MTSLPPENSPDVTPTQVRPSKHRPESLHWWQWCFGVVLPSLFLYFTFVAPTMKFDPTVLPAPVTGQMLAVAPGLPGEASKSVANPRVTLLLDQHKKCGDEIRMRLEEEEHWFHYKFGFIGVMLAGYLLRTIFREVRDKDQTEFLPPARLREVFKHVSTLGLLGTCCAVCIVADMHIRANRIIIYENGAWIAAVVEPLLFGTGPDRGVGWESFLRLDGAHHTDSSFHLLFWPEIFLVTVAVYAAYSYIFFWQVRSASIVNADPRRLEERLRVGSYLVLHVVVLICAVCTHYTPPNFILHPWWAMGNGLTPNDTAAGYFALALCGLGISGLTWIRTRRLRETTRAPLLEEPQL